MAPKSNQLSRLPALPDAYVIPGTGVYPEGVVQDDMTGALFAGSMLLGTIYRIMPDETAFAVMSPAGVNGCTSTAGLRVDAPNRRLFACGGVTGRVYVFDADSGAMLGRYTNGLAPQSPATMAPNAIARTFINDVAIVAGDAYFTDSYEPVLYRLPKAALDSAVPDSEGQLDRWLPFEGTVLKYEYGDSVPARFNLNGILATPDGQFLIVVQTNTGKLFRIGLAARDVVEISGKGNPGGDGMLWEGADALVIDMAHKPTLTRLRFDPSFATYEVVGCYDAPGNLSPTGGQVIGRHILLTESQISDVLVGGAPEHLPYRITVHPLSAFDG